MFKISKTFRFEASHQLFGLHDGHKCSRLHGHSYTVRVVLCSESLDPTGFVRDFGELNPLKQYIDQTLDHRHLNDVIDQPTSENLARHIYEWCVCRWAETKLVIVSETPNTYAEYSR